MMGVNHAISGAAAWVLVTSTAANFPALSYLHVEPVQMVAGAAVCAGAALLPDADHHNATIAHSVPIAGRVAAGAAGALTGGHRHGLHSILAIVGCWFLMGFIGDVEAFQFTLPWLGVVSVGVPLLVTAALLCFSLKVLKVAKSWLKAWLIGSFAAILLNLFFPNELGWFQLCVTLGFTVHILGDFLTVEGINWFWPLKLKAPKFVASLPVLNLIWKENGYFSLPILGKTGSIAEYLFALALGIYAVIGLAVNVLGLAL